jgi:hypothetical protein
MFKQIIADFREIASYLRDTYIVIVSSIKIMLLIFMANLLQRVHNRRFFVALITRPVISGNKIVGESERLKIFDKYMFNSYKRKGWMPKRMTTLQLQQECFYATPLKSNNNVTKEARRKAIKQYTQYSKLMRAVLK